jgi:hypothetical protein
VDLPTFGRPTIGDLGALVVGVFLLVVGREGREHELDQLLDAVAVRRRDRQRIAEAERVEVGSDHRAVDALGLVDDHMHRPPGAAQARGDVLVVRGAPGAAVDQEQQHVGLGDGLLGLARHLVHDAVLGHRVEAGGVDDQIVAVADATDTVVAVAGEAGLVGDERVAGARQAVEQGRLADIGPADQNDGGFHLLPYLSVLRTR